METIHVTFDELTEQMAPVQSSPGPAPNLLTPGPISSGLVPNPAPAIPYVPPTNKELEMLFQPMFDEYFNPPGNRQDPIPNIAQDPVIPTGPSVSIAIDLDAPSGSHTSSPLDHHSSSVHQGVAGEQYAEVNPFAAADSEPFVNVFAPDYNSEASSSGEITVPESNQSTLPHEHIQKWTDSHPLDNIIGNPSRPVSTRKQLATDALWCFYNSVLSKVEPKNFNSAVTEDLMKLDEYGDVLKNKARLVAKGFRQEEGLDFEKNPSPRLLILKQSGYSLLMPPAKIMTVYQMKALYGLKQAPRAWPTKKHLEAVKWVFRYLQGTINMGLWYPKDTAMALTAYADASAVWSSKKQTSTSISSTEAEYIAMSGCCAQILWMRSQLSDYGFAYNRIPYVLRHHRVPCSLPCTSTEYQLADIFTSGAASERCEFISMLWHEVYESGDTQKSSG
ncbi:hypothetical protein Tco_0909396 [Tanacetum coccineum]|uniref:Reverse transcriptase Ty1/copia-type domain-containing protein n=1 Tax=Tanacetum coccineum TaxID=301880 RepID=A0ABQ5CPU9_9ASTR